MADMVYVEWKMPSFSGILKSAYKIQGGNMVLEIQGLFQKKEFISLTLPEWNNINEAIGKKCEIGKGHFRCFE